MQQAAYSPIWSCSERGLPCRELLPVARCALTAPFHPYQPQSEDRAAVYFLWHFPWVRTLQALPGALSDGARTFLCKPRLTAVVSSTPTFLDGGFYTYKRAYGVLGSDFLNGSPRLRFISGNHYPTPLLAVSQLENSRVQIVWLTT